MCHRLLRRCLVACAAVLAATAAFATETAAGSDPAGQDAFRAVLADRTLLFEFPAQERIGAWKRVETGLTELMTERDSVKLALFERVRSDGQRERRIVFLGTDIASPDVLHGWSEYLPTPVPQDREVARRMYEQAMAWVAGQVAQARREGVLLEVDGYSRGALFATVAAGRFGIPATTYNGAPIQLGLEFLTPDQQAQAQQLVVNIHRRDEFTLALNGLMGAKTLGRTYVVQPVTTQGWTDPGRAHSPGALREALLGAGPLQEWVPTARAEAQSLAAAGASAARGLRQEAARIADPALRERALRLAASVAAHAQAIQAGLRRQPLGDGVWVPSADLQGADALRAGPGAAAAWPPLFAAAARHIGPGGDMGRAVAHALLYSGSSAAALEMGPIQFYRDSVASTLRQGGEVPGWEEVYGGAGGGAAARARIALQAAGVGAAGLRMLQATEDEARRSVAARAAFRDGVLADIDTAQVILANLSASTAGLEFLSAGKRHRDKREFYGALGRTFEAQSEVLDYTKALMEDYQAWREHRWVWWRSETLDALGSTLLTGSSLPGLEQTRIGKGLLVQLALDLRKAGIVKYSKTIDAVPTFGVLDAAGALRDGLADGHASIDTIEKMTDALVGATWSAAGWTLGRGNPKVAANFEAAGHAMAAGGRALLRDTDAERGLLALVDHFSDMPYHRLADTLIEGYARGVEQERRSGRKAQDWIAWFGGSGPGAEASARRTLRDAGLNPAQMQRLQRLSDDALAPAPMAQVPAPQRAPRPAAAPVTAPVTAPVPVPAAAGPGGADLEMKVDAGRFHPKPRR